MGTGPSSIANCVGWFEADSGVYSDAGTTPITNGGTVQQWNDLSGDSLHLSQATANNRPYWYTDPNEAVPLVRFPRNDATAVRALFRITTPTLNRAAGAVFAVARSDGSHGSTLNTSQFLFGGGTGGTHTSLEVGLPDAPSPRCAYRLALNGSFNSYTTARVANSWSLMGLNCGASSVTAYLGDQSQASGSAYGSGTSTGYALGAAAGALTLPWSGDVRALFVFNAALSAGDVTALQAYCRNRFNLPTTTHNVVFEGDSMTCGVAATLNNRVLSWQVPLPATYRTHCVARSGEQIAQMVTDFANQVQTCYDSTLGAGKNILVIWAGTNDISGSSGATVYAAYAAYCATARVNGWKVVAVTMLPLNSGGNETNRTDFNTLLRAGYTGFADALCDLDSISLINTVASTSSMYYEGDRIHLSELGNRLVGQVIQTTILDVAIAAGNRRANSISIGIGA